MIEIHDTERQDQAEDMFFFETEREAINHQLGDLQAIDVQSLGDWAQEITLEAKLALLDKENRALHEVLNDICDVPY